MDTLVRLSSGGDRTRRPLRSRIAGNHRRRIANRKKVTRSHTIIYGVVGIVVVGLLWQTANWLNWTNPIIWSSPSAVWSSFIENVNNGQIGNAVGSTAKLFGIGFAYSAGIGLAIGFLIGWYPKLNALLDPLLSLGYALPRIALIPLIVAALGPTFKAQVVIVVLLGAFPIIINVASGVSTVSENHLRLARSFLGTNTDVLKSIVLPGSVPAIISGLRQGMNLALSGVVVAEYFIGATGIGGLIFKAGLTLDTSKAIVGALIFGFGAVVFTVALKVIEGRFSRWRTSE